MPLTKRELDGLDILLNESVLLDAELDQHRRLLGLTLYVEMIPQQGQRAVDDLYLQLILHPIGRLVVSLRYGAGWTDPAARVEEVEAEDLSSALGRIRHHEAIYGWRFFDVPEEAGFDDWRDRLSLDFSTGSDEGFSHTLTIWNEELVLGRMEGRRLLFDLRVWFDDLLIRNPRGERIELEDAIAAGRRYWAAVFERGSGGPSPYPVPGIRIPLPSKT